MAHHANHTDHDGEHPLVRVLFSSTSGQGHVQPLLALARAFDRRGDDTLIVVAEHAAAPLAGAGFSVLAADEPNEAEAALLWSRFGELPRAEASPLVERDWFAGLCLEAMLPTLEKAVRDWHPGLVVRESCEYAGAVVADRARIPHVQHGISTAAAEMSVLRAFSGAILDAHSPGLAKRVAASPYLTRFPASLDPSDYPRTLRYHDRERATPSPLADWWGGSSAPLIYVTLGTVATGTPEGVSVLRAALDALSQLDARILVATGPGLAVETLSDLGPSIHLEPWVSHVDVFAEAKLVACHGGSGTTFGALAAGVPLVMLPMFADQPKNSRLVEEAGAGIAVVAGTGSLANNASELARRGDALRNAVLRVLDTPSYTNAARALASEMTTTPTAQQACDLLADGL